MARITNAHAKRYYLRKAGFTGKLTKFGPRDAGTILFVPILPRLIDYRFDIEVLNAMQRVGRRIQFKLELTTRTWTFHKVEWLMNRRNQRGHIVSNLRGDKIGLPQNTVALTVYNTSMVWKWLNEGTQQKGVVMYNYKPKTTPKKYVSVPGGLDPGQGREPALGDARRMYLSDMGMNRFRSGATGHGIAAREWSVMIRQDFEPVLASEVQKALTKVASRR